MHILNEVGKKKSIEFKKLLRALMDSLSCASENRLPLDERDMKSANVHRSQLDSKPAIAVPMPITIEYHFY